MLWGIWFLDSKFNVLFTDRSCVVRSGPVRSGPVNSPAVSNLVNDVIPRAVSFSTSAERLSLSIAVGRDFVELVFEAI